MNISHLLPQKRNEALQYYNQQSTLKALLGRRVISLISGSAGHFSPGLYRHGGFSPCLYRVSHNKWVLKLYIWESQCKSSICLEIEEMLAALVSVHLWLNSLLFSRNWWNWSGMCLGMGVVCSPACNNKGKYCNCWSWVMNVGSDV